MKYKVKIQKPQAVTTYRVYFDADTGMVTSITHKDLPNKKTYFNVPVQEVEDFLSGTRNLTKHKVVFDVREQRYKIVSIQESIIVYADDLIFKLSKIADPQIIVEQRLKENTWRIYASQDIKSSMKDVGSRMEETMFFSITEKGNPNILYNHYYVSVRDIMDKDFIEFEFTSQDEHTAGKVSVYTNRKFDRYTHEVIDE
jgi:hypothetical protein